MIFDQIIKWIVIVLFSLIIGGTFIMLCFIAYVEDKREEDKKIEADNELIRKYNEE